MRAEPDITLKELAASPGHMAQRYDFPHCSARSNAPGYHIMKGLNAAERDRTARHQARHDWITCRQLGKRQEPHRLVYIGETTVKKNFKRMRRRAPVGERLYGAAPFGRWVTQTSVAGLTQDVLIALWVINGAMNRLAFDTYIETKLAPALDLETLVILDNLSTHKSPRAAEILRKHHCRLLFLPA